MFTKVDKYGREFIAAPENTVLKGYLIGHGFIEHCLVDQHGLVFNRGGIGGWCNNQHNKNYRLVVFPNPVAPGNECNNKSWRWEDWYERNWLCDSWAWMYGKGPKFKEVNNV